MKKIFILGIALAFGLSACTLFGPVPTPWDAYPYQIQAKVTNGAGDAMCPLIPAGWVDEYQGWETANDAYSSLNLLPNGSGYEDVFAVVPFGEGKTAKVFIETTLPSWTVYDKEDALVNPADYMVRGYIWDGSPHFVSNYSVFEPDTKGNVLSLYYPDKTDPLFKVSWVDPCFTFLDIKDVATLGFTWPGFSNYVTVERIDPYFAGEFIFTVKGVDQWHHGSRYTAFRVVFGTPDSAVDMILASLEKPASGTLVSGVTGLNPTIIGASDVYQEFLALATYFSGLFTYTFSWSLDTGNTTDVSLTGDVLTWVGATSLKFSVKLKVDEFDASLPNPWNFNFKEVEKTKGFVYP